MLQAKSRIFENWAKRKSFFPCILCEKQYTRTGTLWNHVSKAHTMDKSQYIKKFGIPSAKIATHSCQICGDIEMLHDETELRNHMVTVHFGLDLRVYFDAWIKPQLSSSELLSMNNQDIDKEWTITDQDIVKEPVLILTVGEDEMTGKSCETPRVTERDELPYTLKCPVCGEQFSCSESFLISHISMHNLSVGEFVKMVRQNSKHQDSGELIVGQNFSFAIGHLAKLRDLRKIQLCTENLECNLY